jgi:hypothetical protein
MRHPILVRRVSWLFGATREFAAVRVKIFPAVMSRLDTAKVAGYKLSVAERYVFPAIHQ